MKAQFRSTYKTVSAARAFERDEPAPASRPAQLSFRLADNEHDVLDLIARCEGEYRLACPYLLVLHKPPSCEVAERRTTRRPAKGRKPRL